MESKEKKVPWLAKLMKTTRGEFDQIKDPRTFKREPKISLSDCLTACFAIFHLKWPSLLQYEVHLKGAELG